MARGVPKESTLVTKAVGYLRVKAQGKGFFVKIHGGMFQSVGLPDVIGCYQGRFVGIEFKLPGKERTLTKIQESILAEIVRAGGIAGMATTPEAAWKIIEDGIE